MKFFETISHTGSRTKLIVLAFIVVLIIFLIWFVQSSLPSFAGLDDKGLPHKSVNDTNLALANYVPPIVDHSAWSALLKSYVSKNGKVDYEGLKTQVGQLNAYLEMLSITIPQPEWPVREQLAYYINAYNAHTVALVLKHYPVESIKDIPGAWTREFINIGDTQISLGGLEHSVLRKMNEPRIHFAINCASVSCPKLLNEAYSPEKLQQQLEMATTRFIQSDENDFSGEVIYLSKIFDWYKDDFQGGNILQFINNYAHTTIAPKAEIRYREYNWGLNSASAL